MNKKMPGRPPRVTYDTIFNVLKDLPIFTETGDVKKKKDPVWKEACTIMPDINLHNLYLFVYQDRKNIKTNLMKHLNIEIPTPIKPKRSKKRKLKKENSNNIWDDYDFYETLDNDETEVSQPVSGNDFDVLISMKNNEEYKNVIHKIGLLPFTVNYWHPQQIAIWSDLIHIESTLSLIVMDDAVSNFAANYTTNSIFLYALAIKIESSHILLAQMMTDSEDSLELEYFLKTWLQITALPPSELVVGYSLSLLNSVSLAFNACTFDEYNLRCYKYMVNEEVLSLPPVLLQIDLFGLIKVIDGWKCFESITQSVKDLYLCSIMYLSTIENLDTFKEAVVSILALCQSPFQNEETETKMKELWTHLTTNIIQEMNQEYIQHVIGENGSRSFAFLNIKQNYVNRDTENEVYDFIHQLKLEAFEMCDFNMEPEKTPNNYYCPVILENLIDLLVQFPSWTKIILKKSEYSTSVSSMTTKHLSLLSDISQPVYPSQFLTIHFEKIKSLLHQAMYYTNVKYKVAGSSKTKVENLQISESICENDSTHHDPLENNTLTDVPNELLDTNAKLDLLTFKHNIHTTVNSLVSFDDFVQNVLNTQIQPGEEIAVCKTILDCCTEIKPYEKYLGILAERFCSTNDAFALSFKEIFIDCYNTLELLDKNELKNSSKLLAHLLISDSISWDILSIVKLNEREMTNSKKNFVRILLRELAERMGLPKLQEKFEIKAYKPFFKGLFPSDVRDAHFATSFMKAIGLKGLGLKKENPKTEEGSSTLQRSSSNSSLSSNSSSSDFIIELRVSRKFGKHKNGQNEKRQIVVLK